jgi:hypothetical protein
MRPTVHLISPFALGRAAGVVAVLFLAVAVSRAGILYQSTTVPNLTGCASGGTGLNSTQYVGVNFTVTAVSHVTSIGGDICNLVGNTGQLFGAILPLIGTSSFPAFPTQVNVAALGGVTFVPNGDVFAPLSLTLQPGNYVLILGSGLFGADGSGFVTGVNPAPPDLSNPFYVTAIGGPSSWQPWVRDAVAGSIRFDVYGDGAAQDFTPTSTPEPSSFLLGATALVALGSLLFQSGMRSAKLRPNRFELPHD